MRRREFIALFSGAVLAQSAGARAQQAERPRRIGVLMSTAADDPESRARVGALLQGLQELGWTDGRNIRLEYRWGEGITDRIRDYAAELVALTPDVVNRRESRRTTSGQNPAHGGVGQLFALANPSRRQMTS
jgi:putative tryptophan/tyrosine transport system substrate-binding protein